MTDHTRIVIHRREAVRIAAELTQQSIPFHMDVRAFDANHFTVNAEYADRLNVLCDADAPHRTMVMYRKNIVIMMQKVVEHYTNMRPVAGQEVDADDFDRAQVRAWAWYDAACYPPIASHDPEQCYTVTMTDGEHTEYAHINVSEGFNGWYYSIVLAGADGVPFGLHSEDNGPQVDHESAVYNALIDAMIYVEENDYDTVEFCNRLASFQMVPYASWQREANEPRCIWRQVGCIA